MASINDGQILITFEELKQLEIRDISLCIDKYQALDICEKSSVAQTGEIYNLWVRKLFKAYDVTEFKDNDWLQILVYMEKILDQFIHNLSTSKADSTLKQLNQWWADTLEFLKWVQSIITNLDVRILRLILSLGFGIIIKTIKITDKRNRQPITKIQQNLLHIITNNMLKMDLQNAEDFKGLNKVLTSLCDVGSIISSCDIKLSIETWRTVAKITGKCNEYYNEIDNGCKENIKDLKFNWTEKPIVGIINELRKLFKYSVEDDTALNNNDNLLKVAQFYLKLIKIVLKSTQTFPAVKEYCEAYIIFMHQIKKKTKSKIIDSIQSDLNEILAFTNKQAKASVENYLCQHLLDDNKEFVSCDLILEYMRICFGKGEKSLPDVRVSCRIFDILFDAPLIFVDSDKYPKMLLYYAALTAEDATGELHTKWCKNVVESSWIKAYASCEILRIYYGFLIKSSAENAKSCLEFWTECWQKFNVYSTTAPFNHQRYLLQMIIKTIVDQLPRNIIEQCFDKCANSEIILLKCGQDNVKLLCYLNTNLANNLKKIHDKKLVRKEYTELLNLLDVWCSHPKFVNFCAVKDDLLKAFLNIFSLPLLEMRKFSDFFYRCFPIFKSLNNRQIDNTILKCLQDNLHKTKAVVGAFMLDYLSNQKPQSEQLLKSLQTPEVIKIQTFLDTPAAKPVPSQSKDLQLFQVAFNKSLNTSSESDHYVHSSKRPRVGSDCYSSDYKFILNEMFEHSHQLLNAKTTMFDNKDYELLNCIKHNIEKCLIK